MKTNSEAADRSSSRTADVLQRLRERAEGTENRSCEPPSPGLAALPFIFKPLGFFFRRGAGEDAASVLGGRSASSGTVTVRHRCEINGKDGLSPSEGRVAELPSNLARGLSGRRDFGPRMGGTLSTLSTHSTLTTRASICTLRLQIYLMIPPPVASSSSV